MLTARRRHFPPCLLEHAPAKMRGTRSRVCAFIVFVVDIDIAMCLGGGGERARLLWTGRVSASGSAGSSVGC